MTFETHSFFPFEPKFSYLAIKSNCNLKGKIMKRIIIMALLVVFAGINLVLAQKNATDEKPAIVKEFERRAQLPFPPRTMSVEKNAKYSEESPLSGHDKRIYNAEEPESEIHAAINPKDSNWMAVSPIRMISQGPSAGLQCPIYYTKDFGSTWQKSSFVNSPRREELLQAGGGDPMLAFDADGELYLSWLNMGMTLIGGMIPDSLFMEMYWARSEDGGENWIREEGDIIVGAGMSAIVGGIDPIPDKQWTAVDLTDGEFRNRMYTVLVLLKMKSQTEIDYDIVVYRKDKGESAYDPNPTVLTDDSFDLTQHSQIEVDGNGRVHAMFYGSKSGNNSLYYCYSDDGGDSFTDPKKITDFEFYGYQNFPGYNPADTLVGLLTSRFYACPQLAVEKSSDIENPNVYVTWTAYGIGERAQTGIDVYFSKSEDGGATWSEPKIVNDDGGPNAQYYSTIDVNENGVIVMTWYDRRDDPANLSADYYMAFSFDEGETFEPQFAISSQKSNFSEIGMQNGGFGIGEYNATVTTKGYAIPFWADGRGGFGSLDVYAAFVPISRDANSVERYSYLDSEANIESIFPNPASDRVEFDISGKLATNATVRIVGIEGGIFLKEDVAGNTRGKVDVSKLPSGSYFLVLEGERTYSAKRFEIVR